MIGFTGKQLVSQHLTFRLLENCDKQFLFKILQEQETTLPAGFLPVSDMAAFNVFWNDLTQYNTGIAILLENQCIGYYHIHPWKTDEEAYQGKSSVMIGFLIGRDYIRHGYGEETLMTLDPYFLEQFDCIWGDYIEGNIASKMLLEKCGFTPVSSYEMEFANLEDRKKKVISNVLCR